MSNTTLEIRENENLYICPECGAEIDMNDRVYVHGLRSDFYVCEDCLSNYSYDDYQEHWTEHIVREVLHTNGRYIEDDSDVWDDYDVFECDDCGDLYPTDYRVSDDCGTEICEDCYEYSWRTCEDCGRLINEGNTYYANGYAYCGDCIGDHDRGLIEGYSHTQSYLTFYKCDDEPDDIREYFGVELEVDYGDDGGRCSRDMDDCNQMQMYFKEDGSLNDEGFEVVSSPATLRYHLEHVHWDEIQDTARRYGFRSHDTSTCGLHVHVSRKAFGRTEMEQELHIAILMMLENKFSEKFHTFARRDACRWCADNLIDIKKEDSYKTIKEKSDQFKNDRYYAINVTNRNTVEFRCFKGTLKYETLVATLQFVATMTRYCQQITTADVESVEWEDIFANTEYTELREYMESRGLLTSQQSMLI